MDIVKNIHPNMNLVCSRFATTNVACDVGANNVRVASYGDLEYRSPRRNDK